MSGRRRGGKKGALVLTIDNNNTTRRRSNNNDNARVGARRDALAASGANRNACTRLRAFAALDKRAAADSLTGQRSINAKWRAATQLARPMPSQVVEEGAN